VSAASVYFDQVVCLCGWLGAAPMACWVACQYDLPVFEVLPVFVCLPHFCSRASLVLTRRLRALSMFVLVGHVVYFMFVVCFWYVNLFVL